LPSSANKRGMQPPDLGIETTLVHGDRTDATGSAVTPPIYQTSTFVFGDADAMAAAAQTPTFERFYTRYGNPNHGAVERILAAIEGGEAAMVSASGMGAISSTVVALTAAGAHVVAQRMIYDGARALVSRILSRFGVEVTFVDQHDTQAFAAAMRPNTRLVMLESPSNPLLGITDIAAVSRIAHDAGALVSIDSTIATPVNQCPLDLGVDVVLHSATKYLGGHSDLIAGAVVASRELIARIWDTHHILGSTLGPFEAWLLLRGLRTLEMRVERHNHNALAVARAMEAHPRVTRVYYPGLESHPGHAVAKAQMRGFGGLVSIEIDGTFDDARSVIDRLRLFHSAASLGGVESLVAQPAAMWPNSSTSADARAMGIIPSLLRLSIGIERAEDLIADLTQALGG
ncbi:MAG TPA: aminotransferase class I/II-fold pyridoxal phosphate-dependent enzyme, partial [Verrucomicrobiae bacterium]|nr:aminotransferase class I/II-fold pyridoxal phosphate-dependent enzyme [Verrucomicrobiae bacterium]